MLKSQVFQYYTEKLWEKIKTTFMSKNDALNGVILDYKWKLIKSSTPITDNLEATTDGYKVTEDGKVEIMNL